MFNNKSTKNIYRNLKNPQVKIFSNLVLRVNDLFLKLKIQFIKNILY